MQRESVLAYLDRLFNTREHNAPAQPDLGLPAPTEIAYEYPASIDRVRRKLLETIDRYEPRLHRVQITYVQSDNDVLHLYFQAHARLALDPDGPPLSFTIVVGAGGDVVIRRPE